MSLAKLLLTAAAISSIALSAPAQDKALIGTWEGWLVNGDGSQTAQRQSRIGEMVIAAAQISSKNGRGTSMGAGTYKVGAAGAVKTIDATGIVRPTDYFTTPQVQFHMVFDKKK